MFSGFSTEEIKNNFTNFKKMEQKKNPLLAGIISAIPAVINTVGSLIRDKRKSKEGETDVTNVIHEDIASGVSLSSKRIMNIAGTGIIITFALSSMAGGLTRLNVIILALGIAYSVTMAFLTYLSEKKK